VRHVAARCLRRQRTRSIVTLVAVHAALWLAGGVALQVGALWVLGAFGPVAAALGGLAIVVVWEASPIAQRLRNQHHALPPLAAFGRAADRDLLVYAVEHAAVCLGACWALMLLPSLSGPYQGPVLVLCSLWVWAQALETPTSPRWRIPFPTRTGRLVKSRLLAV
jgi:hypothetical protein